MSTTVYTDGSCQNNIGGWACIFQYEDGTSSELSGYSEQTTNNRMEMVAAIEGLKALPPHSDVELYSDSAYLVNCFLDRWYVKWQANGWLNGKKKPVENRDLWEELLTLVVQHKVKFCKVKGHSDNKLNNLCDKLANNARKSRGNELPAC
jgi:ribonuclease HI